MEKYKIVTREKELEKLKYQKKEKTLGGFIFGGIAGFFGLITYASLTHPNSFFGMGSKTYGILSSIGFAFAAASCYIDFKKAYQTGKKAKGLEKEIAELEKE